MPARGGMARGGLGLLAGGGLRLPAEFFARPLGDVLPLVGGLVLLRLARARVLRRAAIVLPGLGDAVAFFLVALVFLGAGRLREADGEKAREGRVKDLVVGAHGITLTLKTFSPARK